MTEPEHSAELVRTDEDWLLAVEFVRGHYAEDIFPPDSESLDARSASLCRTVCDYILKIATDRAQERAEDFKPCGCRVGATDRDCPDCNDGEVVR